MEAVCGHVNALSVREVSYASFADPRGVHSRVIYSGANGAAGVLSQHGSPVTSDRSRTGTR